MKKRTKVVIGIIIAVLTLIVAAAVFIGRWYLRGARPRTPTEPPVADMHTNGFDFEKRTRADKADGRLGEDSPSLLTESSRGQEKPENGTAMKQKMPMNITVGTAMERGFLNDNILHSEIGDIHYSSYIPESYDGSRPYALFITLPGWEGLYFQGVGANMVEDFGTEAIKYNEEMIILSTQLNDWGETSADHAIALTEYFLEHYNIDPQKVYLHGMSGGGETGSIVMGKHPELYTAYLETSSKWDGDLETLADSHTPVYMAIGEDDSYYGSDSLKQAYETLHELYLEQGLTDKEIERILVLDVKEQKYFSDRGYRDQHAGGLVFAHDEGIMGWLFGEHDD